MGAFLSAIGGAGREAVPIGEQVRGLLEQRRNTFADMIGQAAQREDDPQTKAALLQHSADLLSGKPIGKIVQNFSQTMQKRQQDNQALDQGHQALTQLMGQAPPAQEPTPRVAGPGQMPGTATEAPSAAPAPAAGSPFTYGGIENGVAPQAPPAAQPTTNPIQGGSQIQVPTLPAPGAGAAALGGLTPPRDPAEIIAKYVNAKRHVTSVNYPMLDEGMKQELAENEQRQLKFQELQAAPVIARQRLEMIEPYLKDMDPQMANFMRMQTISGGTGMLPGLVGAQFGQPIREQMDVTGMEPKDKAALGLPPDATGKYTIERDRIGHRIINAYQGWAGSSNALDSTGNITRVSNNQQLGPNAAENVASSLVTPHAVGTNGAGNPLFQSLEDMRNGVAPAQGVGINPSFIPSTSTTSTPGQLPTTTRRTKGAGASAPTGGGLAPIPSAGGSLEQRKYQDWASGGPAPSGKELTAVQQYAAANNLPTPQALSAGGQKAIAAIDPVLDEVKRTKTMLEAAIKNGVGQAQLAKDYLKYKLHQDSPNTALISNLSFSALRSAVSALAGSGSRAYPVLKMALEHTPSALGDPERSLKLLNEMETRINEARSAVLQDEKKSGVLVPPGGGLSPVPVPDPDNLRQLMGAH